jgi:hypothetical protein
MNVGNHVGSPVGFASPPDSIPLSTINGLKASCRKCRASRKGNLSGTRQLTCVIAGSRSFCGT